MYYHGQSLGLILATSKELAYKAANIVKVTYENVRKPIVDIEEALEKVEKEGKLAEQSTGVFSTKPNDDIKVVHTLKGTLRTGSQYHFYMETQSAVCYPREDGIDVHCSTQVKF